MGRSRTFVHAPAATTRRRPRSCPRACRRPGRARPRPPAGRPGCASGSARRPPRRVGDRRRGARRLHLAAVGMQHAADDPGGEDHTGRDLLDVRRRERLLVLDARMRGDDLEVRVPGLGRRRRPEAAVALVAEVEAVILGQRPVEVDPVALEYELLLAPGRHVAAAPAADEATAGLRCALRQAVALEHEDVLDAPLEQVQRRGASEDAAADDDDFSPLGKAHAHLACSAGIAPSPTAQSTLGDSHRVKPTSRRRRCPRDCP